MTGTKALDRRLGAVLGLAIGDAAGWPARVHRSRALPAWTRRVRRELDAFAEDRSITTLPVPFALNQDPTPLRLGPSDDAEWAAWTLGWLGDRIDHVTREQVHEHWSDAVRDERLPLGRISVAAAAENIRRGLPPPTSGRFDPHHFDDAGAVRAVAIGAVAPDPDRAVAVAEWDAEVTNAGDGLDAARALAGAIAYAVDTGTNPVERLRAALPSDRPVAETIERALTSTKGAGGPAEAVPLLDDIVDRVYSYGTAAAQTLAVAAALTDVTFRTGAPPIAGITAAATVSSLADSAPALTGALLGAAYGIQALPTSWVERCRRLVGCCDPELAGTDLIDLMKGMAR